MAIETGVACKIPGRFKKGIQGVGFTLRFSTALWADGFIKAGVFFDGGTDAVHDHVFRQDHRQLLGWHRHFAATGAMHDGDRAAPVALARHAPIA